MIITASMQAALASGTIAPRWILLLSARNRDTGNSERIGFWSGDDVRTFEIGGYAWACYPGTIVEMSAPEASAGLEVRSQRVTLFAGSPAVVQAIRLYEPRLAPGELHLAMLDPGTHTVIGTTPVFCGLIDAAAIREQGATATVEVTLVSALQAGTGHAALRKSDASQRLRSATDSGRAYADVAGSVPVVWGGDSMGAYVVPRPGG